MPDDRRPDETCHWHRLTYSDPIVRMASNCLQVNRPRRQFVSPPRRWAYSAEERDFVPRCRYKYGVTSRSRPADRRSAQVTVAMPAPDQTVLARRDRIVAALRAIVPGEGVIAAEREMRPYESDGLTAYHQLPMVVVLPETTQQVSRVLEFCHAERIKVVPRGAGTSLSGGALPLADGVLLGMAKFNRIREIDFANRVAVVEPGVTNLAVTQAVEEAGFYYAPDPSSQIACTIGGNVAENSGGVHCLKYGMTTNNLLGCELVLMTGEVIRIGGKHLDAGGYDLLGVITGSEGLLGVVTEITVRILKKPECARAVLVGFACSEDAGECVSKIIGAGIIPAGMEMMDRPAIHAVEEFVHAGYPLDVEALLIVEVDGPQAEVDHLVARVEAIAQACRVVTCRVSSSEEERLLFWAGRKAAFPAVGRISPDYYCMDGTIPRARLPQVLHRMRELSQAYGLRVANVFHAGDGNLHPLILYDANKPGELERTEAFGAEILKLCVEVGGVLTGEHGVGVEKRDLMPAMFTEADLAQQQRLKCAFDERGLLNPGKVFPTLHRCAELGRIHVHAGKVAFPDIPRF
jgi:glycolate oxidase